MLLSIHLILYTPIVTLSHSVSLSLKYSNFISSCFVGVLLYVSSNLTYLLHHLTSHLAMSSWYPIISESCISPFPFPLYSIGFSSLTTPGNPSICTFIPIIIHSAHTIVTFHIFNLHCLDHTPLTIFLPKIFFNFLLFFVIHFTFLDTPNSIFLFFLFFIFLYMLYMPSHT